MIKIIYPKQIDPYKPLPKVTARKTLATSKQFTIEQTALVFSNGTRRTYEKIVGGKGGAVLIIAITKENRMLLIREYCGGKERYELAFPKGKLEPDESIEQAANRELQEETGYWSNRVTFLKTVSLAPGYMGHNTHILLAENLEWSPSQGDEPEDIEVYPWAMDDISTLIQRDDFTEARSIAALNLAISHIQQRR